MPETAPAFHPLLAKRWSPRAFSSRPVDPVIFRSLFEAARWSASSFNEQPWRFIVATKDNPEEFDRILHVLVEKNQEWAKTAYALVLMAGKKTFSHNGSPNRFGLHDAGAAAANLMIQASASGLHVHGMGGLDPVKARSEFGIPDDFEVGAAFAVGYLDGPDEPPASRTRKALSDLVFAGHWGHPARL